MKSEPRRHGPRGTGSAALHRFVPAQAWKDAVRRGNLRYDLFAGLTGAGVVLPQGVAFAIIAGMPPEYGLFTAIIVCAVSAIWGASMVMVSGPTSAISAVVFATLSTLAAPQSAEFVALAIQLTLIVGLLQLAAGLFALGALIAFVSSSVLAGFTAAAAVQIATAQIGPAFGLSVAGGGIGEQVTELFSSLGQFKAMAAAISGITLAVLVACLIWLPKLPGYLLALVAGSLASHALDSAAQGVLHFSALESVLPRPALPQFTFGLWGEMLPGASAVAFVGLLSAISIGKTFAMRRGERYDSNQEIIGQGLGNAVGGVFQCLTGSGSFTRSGVNVEAGARTPLSAIFASVFLTVMLVVFAPFVRYVPVPAMATVIFVVAWKLVNIGELRGILRSSRSETGILVLTFATGLVTGLDFAILVGVLASLGVFLFRSAHPVVAVGAPAEINGRRVFMNAHSYDLPQCPQIALTRLEGPVFFASVDAIESEFRRFEVVDGTKTRLLNLRGVGRIDLSGANFILQEARRLQKEGFDLRLIVSHPGIMAELRAMHLIELLGEDRIHAHKSEAIAAAVIAGRDDICRDCHLRLFAECAMKPAPD